MYGYKKISRLRKRMNGKNKHFKESVGGREQKKTRRGANSHPWLCIDLTSEDNYSKDEFITRHIS